MEIFVEGYKGRGMCAKCAFSEIIKLPTNKNNVLSCKYYGSLCRLVSRNCSGIKLLKDKPLPQDKPGEK